MPAQINKQLEAWPIKRCACGARARCKGECKRCRYRYYRRQKKMREQNTLSYKLKTLLRSMNPWGGP